MSLFFTNLPITRVKGIDILELILFFGGGYYVCASAITARQDPCFLYKDFYPLVSANSWPVRLACHSSFSDEIIEAFELHTVKTLN